MNPYLGALNRRQYDVHPAGDRFMMVRAGSGLTLDVVYVENWFTELEEQMR